MDRQQPPKPDKIRKMTGGFGWVDHRIRWFMEDMKQEEILLYFFLVVTGNELGCSWWPTRKVTKMLGIGPASLQRARGMLERRGLIATKKDELSSRIIYQLLPLPIEENERVEIPMKLTAAEAGGLPSGAPGKKEKGRAGEAAARRMVLDKSKEQEKLNEEGLSRLRNLLGVAGRQ